MSNRFASILAVLALILSLAALVLAWRAAPDGGPAEQSHVPEHAEEAEELAHLMAYVQRYAEKLYFAGMADNAALAEFYAHELEETVDDIAAGGYEEGGRDVGEAIEELFEPRLEGVEAAIAAQALSPNAEDARALFEARYRVLVEGCNACHEATDHGYIRIVVPETSGYPNQSFARPGA